MDIFVLGRKFTSFAAVKQSIEKLSAETGARFIIKDCLKLERATTKYVKYRENQLNWSLLYQKIRFLCDRGGVHRSKSRGLRKRSSCITGCKAMIYLSITQDFQHLELLQVELKHNHEMAPKPLTRIQRKAERRRLKLMEELEIPYEIAYQIERKDYYSKHPEESSVVKEQLKEVTSNADEIKQESFDADENIESLASDEEDQHVKIYTKVGDSGISYTFNGQMKQKDDNIFEASGTTEELCSAIGVAAEFLPEMCDIINLELRKIQSILQDLAVHIATPKDVNTDLEECYSFQEKFVSDLEDWIDNHAESLPQSIHIILPSGGKCSSALHFARSICRRAERRILCLVREDEVSESALKFLNRLGDYLFIIARKLSFITGAAEYSYKEPILESQKQNLNIIHEDTEI